jgi:NAD(P)H-nitrite reductase large subunit
LAQAGSDVTLLEATPLQESVRGLAAIARDPEVLRQTIGYLATLGRKGIRPQYGRAVTAVHGQDRVEAATITRVDRRWRPVAGTEQLIRCDAVCLGYGFVPNVETARMLGCELGTVGNSPDLAVSVTASLRTSQPNVYACGEATGVAGVRVAILEGQLAGLAAARDVGGLSVPEYERQVRSVQRRLGRLAPVATWVRRAFRPRRGLWDLPLEETVICRCEEVTLGSIRSALTGNERSIRAVKSATRAGMGLCQGHMCQPFLVGMLQTTRTGLAELGELPASRPPVRPVPIGDWLLADARPSVDVGPAAEGNAP